MLAEATGQFGLSPDAVRKHVAHGTLASVRHGGRLYVVLPDAAPDGQQRPDSVRPPDRAQELIDQQCSEITRLVEQLAIKGAQLWQANVIIAQLTQWPATLAAPVSPSGDTTPAANGVPSGCAQDVTTAEVRGRLTAAAPLVGLRRS